MEISFPTIKVSSVIITWIGLVISGIPQRTIHVLRPLLLLMHINDLPQYCNITTEM